jgi:hypothetical protein
MDDPPIAMSSSSSTKHAEERFHALLKATLEAWAHQILYSRGVYPRSTFCPTTVWGLRCQACRAKEVVRYIQDSIDQAMLALVKGAAASLTLVIVDDDDSNDDDDDDDNNNNNNRNNRNDGNTDGSEQERWTLAFSYLHPSPNMPGVLQAEKFLRALLLRVQSLVDPRQRQGKVLRITDSTSFRLVWRLMPTADPAGYGALKQGVQEGRWMADAHRPKAVSSGRLRRPLHHISSTLVELRFYSEVSSTVAKRQRRAPVAAATATNDVTEAF